jgi:hypothetical protein
MIRLNFPQVWFRRTVSQVRPFNSGMAMAKRRRTLAAGSLVLVLILRQEP